MQFLATPLGWLLWLIYQVINNYFLAIFVFTFVTRLITFPFAIKSQKTQARRAKLHPKISRLQKKYSADPKKLQEMQMQLYEREGISQTEGCGTSIIQMVLLFGIIAVIYSPLKYISRIPTEVITASQTAIKVVEGETEEYNSIKFTEKELKSYSELKILQAVDSERNLKDMEIEISKLDKSVLKDKTPAEYVESIKKMREDFSFLGQSLLQRPLGENYFPPTLSVLLLIPVFSYLTSLFSSWISQKMIGNQGAQGQQGQGCMKFGMVGIMPVFSLVMTITVPSAVGAYWVSSNIVAVIQTVVVNKIYDLNKIRAQAEIDFVEERRQHREDKKRLAEMRKQEQRKMALEQQNSKEKKGTKSKKDVAALADASYDDVALKDDVVDLAEMEEADKGAENEKYYDGDIIVDENSADDSYDDFEEVEVSEDIAVEETEKSDDDESDDGFKIEIK